MKKSLKRFFAAGLTAAMVMSMGMTAMAAGTINATSVTFKKAYTVTGNTEAVTFPYEKLEFTVEADSANPEDKLITIGADKDNTHDVIANADTLTINIPKYEKVGQYLYTVTEKDVKTQGVGYKAESFKVEILAYHNPANYDDIITDCAIQKLDGSDKLDTITNTYDLGTLAVKKTVSGNLADQTKEFDVTVTFKTEDGKTVNSDITYDTNTEGVKTIEKGWTGEKAVVISLRHNETITFKDIPAGVTYTVEEADYVSLASDTNARENDENGYDDPKYTYSDEDKAITQSDEDTVTINNNKESEINTGISLDNMPYFMVLALVALGLVGFVSKKRSIEF